MNRAERRRSARNNKPEPVINVKYSDIKNIKRQVSEEAANNAFLMMLAIPVMVLHDNFGSLMRKELNGKPREERFAELCLDLYDSFERGYVTTDDLHKCLLEEAGLEIRAIKKKKGNF